MIPCDIFVSNQRCAFHEVLGLFAMILLPDAHAAKV
jgi:hypothetical protein